MKRMISISIAVVILSINSVSADMWREVLPGAPGSPNAAQVTRFDSQYDPGGFAGHADERDELVLESWSYPGRIHTMESEGSEAAPKTDDAVEMLNSTEESTEQSERDDDVLADVSDGNADGDETNIDHITVN